MPFLPVVVAASMAKLMSSVEFSVLLVYVWFMAAVFLGCLLVFLVSGAFVAVLGRISPLPFATQIVVDLSRLEYVSSAGLRVLLRLAKQAKKEGKDFALVAAPQGMVIC